MAGEQARIRFVVERDGAAAARQWVTRTLQIYRDAIDNAGSHGSIPHYRPLFEESIAEFEQWLRDSASDDDASR